MREAYHEQLDEITRRLTEITERIGELMQRASSALLSGNTSAADQVIAEATELAPMRDAAEALALRLMAEQQPVATDLRILVSAFHINFELERMGALAEHIAWITTRAPEMGTLKDVLPTLNRAASLAGTITGLVTELLATRNLQLVAPIQETETAMDAVRVELFRVALDPSWTHGIELCIPLTEAARYYERYADHAVKIADRVAFIVTGKS
jgi:phosphate transport system protein